MRKLPRRQLHPSTRFMTIRQLLLLLAVVVSIRQTWFELYKIPSGSMQPTLKQQDHLLVAKTAFGCQLPLARKPLLFDRQAIRRGSIAVFTGHHLPIPNGDTRHFYLFPGKKQYIKRIMGLPGDTLYFYGGQIYGIDRRGHPITPACYPQTLPSPYLPFLTFDGEMRRQRDLGGMRSFFTLYQANMGIAALQMRSSRHLQVTPLPLHPLQPAAQEYFELWGIKNFAMARLLRKDQLEMLSGKTAAELPPGCLYLELKHSPSFAKMELAEDRGGPPMPTAGVSTSILPLPKAALQRLFNNLYTTRFTVTAGCVKAWEAGKTKSMLPAPQLPGVPNGTYEFIAGQAYRVFPTGVTQRLANSHPLATFSEEKMYLLFNLGMEFDPRCEPYLRNQHRVPTRYAFFRHGDLWLMDRPFLQRDDPLLRAFVQQEEQQAQRSLRPYHPFIDHGPPLDGNGNLDRTHIARYGMRIPEWGYLALGDNHATSCDSRVFGCVPQGNFRGQPLFLYWPPGQRWGLFAVSYRTWQRFFLPLPLIAISAFLWRLAGDRWRRRDH